VEAAQGWLRTPHAQTTIRRCPAFAEWAIAEAKSRHGLRQATCRGLEKVTIQALYVARVQNLKRLIRGRFTDFLAVVHHMVQGFSQRFAGPPALQWAC